MNRFTDFTEEEQRMLAEALWKSRDHLLQVIECLNHMKNFSMKF